MDMIKVVLRALACVLILSAGNVFAQPSMIKLLDSKQLEVLTTPQVVSKENSEIFLLREQNKLMKDFQASQQTTVYWALSGVLGFVFILTGLSYLTNFKFYEQDKERLRQEFESKLLGYRADVNLQLEEYKGTVNQLMDQKNQFLQDKVFDQLAEARSLVESVRSELVSDIKTINEEIKKVYSRVESLRQDLESAEVELREVESVVWDIKKIPGNMLITQTQALKAAVRSKSYIHVQRVVSKIHSLLEEKYIHTGGAIKPRIVTWITESLDFAEELDPEGVEKARTMLSSIPVIEEGETIA